MRTALWFALNYDRPLTAFAGIWTEFKGDRRSKSKPIPGPHLVYGFLTTAPNAVVEPIHPKVMPVILTTDEECDAWLRVTRAGETDLTRLVQIVTDAGARFFALRNHAGKGVQNVAEGSRRSGS
jgi:putative SOS response-associated peptidase YedK